MVISSISRCCIGWALYCTQENTHLSYMDSWCCLLGARPGLVVLIFLSFPPQLEKV